MTIWNDIVEAANNRDPCDRCGGKGKVPLFSSVEDPCRKCDGFGSLSPSDSSDDDADDDSGDGGGEASGSSSGTQTKQNTIPSPLAAFLDHKAQALSQKSQFDRWRVAAMPLSHSTPKQADLDQLVDKFQALFSFKAKHHPNALLHSACVSAPKPHIFFRRGRNSNVNLNLMSHASDFQVHTCWNKIPSQPPPSVIPQNTLAVVSFVPLQCAVYCKW